MSAKTAWAAEYRRWKGESSGVWSRRLAICRYGLRLSLKGKIIRIFLTLSVMQTLILLGVFFLFGQLVAPDSALIQWISDKGGQELTITINAVTSWMLLYPEICVDGIYRIMFFLLSFSCPFISMIIVALFIHRLIAGDVASQAIVIYKSKALGTADYLMGKFGVVAAILSAVWIAPVVLSWVIGNLLSPDWSFFWHSLPSLLRGLTLSLFAVVSLSCVAMAASALAGRARVAVVYWIIGWMILSVIGNVASVVHPIFKLINPLVAIRELSFGIFRIDLFLEEAQAMLPFFGGFLGKFTDGDPRVSEFLSGSPWAPAAVLLLMSIGSLYVVTRRIRQS